MVKLEDVRAVNKSLATSRPLVAVFVGVAGIAGYAACTLAKAHGSNGKGLRVYLVGRTLAKVQPLIDECQKACPVGQFLFVQAKDLALLKDVDEMCVELVKMEEKEAKAKSQTPKINILVMGQANFAPFAPRQGILPGFTHVDISTNKRAETTEGLDTFMSLIYYSRMRLTVSLLPLLLACPPESPAHIVSIFSPKRDASFIPTDISLRNPNNYGFMSSGSHAAYLKTFYMEHLAALYPGKLAFVHYFPGLVITPAFNNPEVPWWMKFIFKYGMPVIRWYSLPKEECGERVLFNASERWVARGGEGKEEGEMVVVASDGVVGGGAYKVDTDGEVVPTGKQYAKMREEGWLEKAVEHTDKVFAEIKAGRKFTE